MKRTVAVILILMSVRAQAFPQALCAMGTSPPEFPLTTVLHIFTWDLTDQVVWPLSVSEATVVPPFGVSIGNNPIFNSYNAIAHPGFAFVQGILPSAPSGPYLIEGNNTMHGVFQPPGFPGVRLGHPGNNFKCFNQVNIP